MVITLESSLEFTAHRQAHLPTMALRANAIGETCLAPRPFAQALDRAFCAAAPALGVKARDHQVPFGEPDYTLSNELID